MRLKYFHGSLNIVLILVPGREFFCAKCVQVSFNISVMKLNEVHFSLETVITHFLDKPYEEINFQSYLNSALLCK